MSGNASQRQGDRKSKEIPEAGEEENGSGPVEKAGKRFHLDHTGRRKLGNGFGNAAGQLGTKAGSKGGFFSFGSLIVSVCFLFFLNIFFKSFLLFYSSCTD